MVSTPVASISEPASEDTRPWMVPVAVSARPVGTAMPFAAMSVPPFRLVGPSFTGLFEIICKVAPLATLIAPSMRKPLFTAAPRMSVPAFTLMLVVFCPRKVPATLVIAVEVFRRSETPLSVFAAGLVKVRLFVTVNSVCVLLKTSGFATTRAPACARSACSFVMGRMRLS